MSEMLVMRVPKEMKEKLIKIAKKEKRSLSKQIEFYLEEKLCNIKQRGKK